jgi:hypothetical protein
MIRRSPAELYLQYLILHPKKYTNEQIREIFQFAQLDYLGDWYVDRLRKDLRPPDPFFPLDQTHTPSYKFLLTRGLARIFHLDASGKKAFQILERPRVKEFVESMLATSAPHVAVALAVTRQHRFACTTEVIDRYSAFFWNMALLDSTELRALLQLRVDALEEHSDPEIRRQHKAVKNASYKDARKTAADLPFSPLSALIAQIRMGVMPSRLDLAQVLDQTRHLAMIRTYEAVSNNGRGDSTRAVDFTTVVEKLSDTLEQIVKPDDNLRNQLASIAMRTETAQIPSIHTLSLGHHTAEVAKMENTNDFSADFDEGDGGDGSSFDAG